MYSTLVRENFHFVLKSIRKLGLFMPMPRANRWEADCIQQFPFSEIRKVFEAANRLKAQGVDVVDVTMGRPDYDTPEHIKQAAKDALDAGKVHYTPNAGIPELLKAIANKMKRDNGLDYDTAGEIIVTVGAAQAIYTALTAFLNPGDEIIIPSPIWLNYVHVSRMLGAKIVPVPLKEENEFALLASDVEKAITPKTKMIVLVAPNNPTGGVMKKEDLKKIAELAVKHDLLVISDEIYEHLIYDGYQHISIASYPGMKERTILVNGVSKAYSMTGWRLGWICTSKEIYSSLIRCFQYMVANATSFAQYGALAALEGPQDCVREMVAEFKRRRDMLVDRINQIPKISCKKPEGAFYVFMNIKQTGMTSVDASTFFLEKAAVAAVPGSAFGEEGEGYIRIAYSNCYENLERGVDNIEKSLSQL